VTDANGYSKRVFIFAKINIIFMQGYALIIFSAARQGGQHFTMDINAIGWDSRIST
jgi:hypothetical protein